MIGVVTLGFALVTALAWVVTAQVINLAERLPEYETEIVSKVQRFQRRFAGGKGGLTEKFEHAAKEIKEASTRPATQSTTQPETQPTTMASAGGAAGPASQPAAAPNKPVDQIARDPYGAAAQAITNSPPKEGPPLGTSAANPLWTVALPAPVSPINVSFPPP